MTEINKDNFKAEIEDYEGVSLIDLYADWCGPCKLIAPVIEELEREYTDVKFCKVNVDNNMEIARAFNVTSIPMIAIVKNGTFVDFSVGYVPKASIAKLIEENR